MGGPAQQRYAIDRKIASGGHATVYLGRGLGPHGFERPVAIKMCHPHLEQGRAEAVIDEARIAARIRHPNVVATLDVVLEERGVMIVMEYVEGTTVAGLVRAAGRDDSPVPVPVALRILGDVLAGLHAAHELKDDQGQPLAVVHRDVSPQNVIASVDGFSKLADFGVFKAEGRLAPSTATGDLKGKLGYVAPEVYRGQGATRRSDIYGAAVVLWEMLAGRRLFDDATHAATMHRALSGDIPALEILRGDVPPGLDAVLARAMALDPSDRYATAEDFAAALERLPVAPAANRAVAERVRRAMTVLGEVPASGPALVLAGENALTPHEYVTPVRETPARSPRRNVIAASLGGVALAGIAFAALTGRPASEPKSAATVTSSAVVASAAPAPPTGTVVNPPSSEPAPLAEPVASAPARPAAATRARPRALQAASVAKPTPSPPPPRERPAQPPTNGRPLYDPEEL